MDKTHPEDPFPRKPMPLPTMKLTEEDLEKIAENAKHGAHLIFPFAVTEKDRADMVSDALSKAKNKNLRVRWEGTKMIVEGGKLSGGLEEGVGKLSSSPEEDVVKVAKQPRGRRRHGG